MCEGNGNSLSTSLGIKPFPIWANARHAIQQQSANKFQTRIAKRKEIYDNNNNMSDIIEYEFHAELKHNSNNWGMHLVVYIRQKRDSEQSTPLRGTKIAFHPDGSPACTLIHR